MRGETLVSCGRKTENRESVKKGKRWMSWYKEKLDEIEVSWTSHQLLVVFTRVFELNAFT